MNRFLYAEANPWTFSDPSGHATCFSSSDLCDETMAIQHQGTQAARDALRRMRSRVNQDYSYARALHANSRRYEGTPQSTPETVPASADTWGESTKIAMASADETHAQAAAVRCTPTRFGSSCQSAQQQADSAATSAGIGDALGKLWHGLWRTAQCASSVGTQCGDLVVGLSQITANPVGTVVTIAGDRLTAIQSGDKRAGADAVTSTLFDIGGLALMPIGGGAADVGEAATIGAKVATPSELVELARLWPDLSVSFADGDMLSVFRKNGIAGMTGEGVAPGTWDMYLNPDPKMFTRDTMIHEYMHYVMQKRNWPIGSDANASHAYIYDFLDRLKNVLNVNGN